MEVVRFKILFYYLCAIRDHDVVDNSWKLVMMVNLYGMDEKTLKMIGNISASAADSLRDIHTASHDDATWILTSAFIIFTMQSGKFLFIDYGAILKFVVIIHLRNSTIYSMWRNIIVCCNNTQMQLYYL